MITIRDTKFRKEPFVVMVGDEEVEMGQTIRATFTIEAQGIVTKASLKLDEDREERVKEALRLTIVQTLYGDIRQSLLSLRGHIITDESYGGVLRKEVDLIIRRLNVVYEDGKSGLVL